MTAETIFAKTTILYLCSTEGLTAKNAKAAKRETKHKGTKGTKAEVKMQSADCKVQKAKPRGLADLECGSVLPLCLPEARFRL